MSYPRDAVNAFQSPLLHTLSHFPHLPHPSTIIKPVITAHKVFMFIDIMIGFVQNVQNTGL